MESTELHLNALVKRLQNDPVELIHFIEYHKEDLSDIEVERLAEELEGDELALKWFVAYALQDEEDDEVIM